jgi:hypothetical protein
MIGGGSAGVVEVLALFPSPRQVYCKHSSMPPTATAAAHNPFFIIFVAAAGFYFPQHAYTVRWTP